MSHEDNLLKAIEYLENKGWENAPELLGAKLEEATQKIDRSIFSKEYCDSKQSEKNSARLFIKSLPNGEEILKDEECFLKRVLKRG